MNHRAPQPSEQWFAIVERKAAAAKSVPPSSTRWGRTRVNAAVAMFEPISTRRRPAAASSRRVLAQSRPAFRGPCHKMLILSRAPLGIMQMGPRFSSSMAVHSGPCAL